MPHVARYHIIFGKISGALAAAADYQFTIILGSKVYAKFSLFLFLWVNLSLERRHDDL